MSELTDTAREMAEDTARAEAVLGEPLNAIDPLEPVEPSAQATLDHARADIETAIRALARADIILRDLAESLS